MKRFAEDTKEYSKEKYWWENIPLVRENVVELKPPSKQAEPANNAQISSQRHNKEKSDSTRKNLEDAKRRLKKKLKEEKEEKREKKRKHKKRRRQSSSSSPVGHFDS